MARAIVSVLLLALAVINASHAARILGLNPTPAKSHSRVMESLLRELANRGHDVTFASAVTLQLPPPRNDSGGTLQHVLLESGDILQTRMGGIVGPERKPITEGLTLWSIAPDLCDLELSTPALQSLLHGCTPVTFDLVIAETFFFDCMVPFAKYFGAPLILFTSQWPSPWARQTQIGNPFWPSVSPNMFLHYGDRMNFVERAHNALETAFLMAYRHWAALPRQDVVVQQHFGKDYPKLSTLEKDAALLLANTNPLLNFPHANQPNVIEVGGLHIQPAQPLPADLKAFLDAEGSKNGVIVISLGSLISSENLPADRLRLLTDTMSQLPFAVLWRWDKTDVSCLPRNVRVESWIPQRDVLAHPAVRALVTHGGLLSAQEASLEGVPRVVLPFFGDQLMNAWRAVDTGVGISLDFYTLQPAEFAEAIIEVVSKPSYRENAQKISVLLRDQPQPPLERAAFWAEYVLRHKGTPYMKSAVSELAWYELYMLDLAGAVLGCLIVFFWIARAILRPCLTGRKVKKD